MSLLRAILFVSLAAVAVGAEPLHVRIDRLIEKGQVGALAAQSTDGEFLRRVHLDLTGRIPSSASARAFLNDKTLGKRNKVIDRLLASPEYARQMAVAFDVELMERRADKHVKAAEWQKYLVDSFAANKPWDKLAAEMFISDGDSNTTTAKAPRAAAKFIMDRDMEVNLVTRDVARKFFGMDLQCAQCHDHPNIADFYQRDYYGIYAFFSRTYIFQPDKKKPAQLAEKPTGDASFKSVFTSVAGRTRPRLPVGHEVNEPEIKPGEEYIVKPDKKKKNLRPVPKYSRRAQLAQLAATNRMFQHNIANRLWGHMMGKAVVEPRDGLHTDNPAAHPALLELLSNGLVELKFDIRAFLREVALTRAYQRSFVLPADLAAPQISVLHEEFKKASTNGEAAQTEFNKAKGELDKARGDRLVTNAGVDSASKAVAAAKKAADATVKPLEDAKKALAAKQDQHKTVMAASTAAKVAADKLKDNKELATAFAKIKVEADKLAAAVAAAQKNTDAKTAANKAAIDKLAAAEKVMTDAQAKWKVADKAVQSFDAIWIAASAKREKAKAETARTMRRWEDAQALEELAQSRTALAGVEQQLAKMKENLDSSRTAMTAVTIELRPHKAAMLAASKRKRAADATRDLQKQLLNKKIVFDKAAADSVAQLKDSSKLMAEALARAVKRNDTEDLALKAKLEAAMARADEAVKTTQVLDSIFKKEVAALTAVFKQRIVAANAETAKVTSIQKTLNAVESRIVEARKRMDEAQGKVVQTTVAFNDSQSRLDAAVDKVTGRWSKNFSTGAFTHLSPEQLCWSMMETAGLVAAQKSAAVADFEKKNPLKDGVKEGAARTAALAKHVEKFVYDKLKGNVAAFVKLFGGVAGEVQTDFYATADQALFFSNGGTVRSWLNPSGNNLTGRLQKLEDPKVLAEELYLSVLTRMPSVEETDLVAKSLADQPKEKSAVVKEMTWGLLTSTEFRFKH